MADESFPYTISQNSRPLSKWVQDDDSLSEKRAHKQADDRREETLRLACQTLFLAKVKRQIHGYYIIITAQYNLLVTINSSSIMF